jgi:fatty-acyl-CoA synthase
VPEPGAVLDAGQLIALCREKLARFKVPKHVLVIAADDVPTTPTGKVQKFRLARRAAEQLAG